MLAIFAAFMMVFLIIGIVFYIYTALALMTIAKKTNTNNPWLAFIPIGNVYLMTQVASVPAWVTAAVALYLIPYLGPLIFAGVLIWLWWKIAIARNKPGWYALLLLIPVVNLVIMGVIAWKD